ncbi:DUF6894 family protein [Methylobacterium oxalidis]|uniref:DUF6894 domain-containing protein n=1 Tax=Methylobacterium oxalidis TaxID=944322 RepID=A0A512JC65_9HYPH|nr:hypothetical protein [Methylobacterium oxalidis]GEP07511.1 hypothetical protein MOX02_55490 [Methylobacterium oxalidis]GJE35099.1 hypothetical protein LDDCCGHA_5317 [Methylobacterium oxalidis]GLS65196.1 hypothetical protein GCM10007888_35780 [Methylobacterium oxalidis]
MPSFYLHLYGPLGLQQDETGFELESVEAAYLLAYHNVPRMAAELARQRLDPHQFKIVITDKKDRYLMTLPFSEALGAKVQ